MNKPIEIINGLITFNQTWPTPRANTSTKIMSQPSSSSTIRLDAAALSFGGTFEKAEFLTYAEAHDIMQRRKKELEVVERKQTSDLFDRVSTYAARFMPEKLAALDANARESVISAIRQDLANYIFPSRDSADGGRTLTIVRLHPFEVASLINIMPESPEEATAYIPSLRKKGSDDDIQSIIDLLFQHVDASAGFGGYDQDDFGAAPPSSSGTTIKGTGGGGEEEGDGGGNYSYYNGGGGRGGEEADGDDQLGVGGRGAGAEEDEGDGNNGYAYGTGEGEDDEGMVMTT